MINVLHIIQGLSLGGAARSMVAVSKYQTRTGNYHHSVVSLLPTNEASLQLAQEAGMDVFIQPDQQTLWQAIERADIVQIEWWNNPEIYQFFQNEFPPMRLAMWCHVAGDHAPQVITPEIRDFPDRVILACPYSYELPVIQSLPTPERLEKASLVYDPADFERLGGLWPKPHPHFNVGYVGTVDFTKMHPNFVLMSAAVEVPDVRFLVCGGGIQETLKTQAQELNALERFDFRGYVHDIRSVLEILDVYGYPLCEDTYAAGELNLQEAMYAGVPPVVFPYGGLKHLVIDEFTGLVVRSEIEYKQAVEYLYHYPEERARLGKNARQYALEIFGAENSAKKMNTVYRQLMARPKSEHLWGYSPNVDITEQSLTYLDLTSPLEELSGSRLFIQSLGEAKEPFETSLSGADDVSVMSAEETIAASTRLLASPYSGGILNFSRFFPGDKYLHLWSGLALAHQGNHREAVDEFQKAIDTGFEHWRVYLYQAHSAMACENLYKAKEASEKVISLNPACRAEKQLLEKVIPLIATYEREMEERRLALLAQIEFGPGFHGNEGQFRWMEDEAHLIVTHPVLSTPVEISFTLKCLSAEVYPGFPLNTKIYVGEKLKRYYTFETDFQEEAIALILPASEEDVEIRLISSQYFIPAEKGMEDTRRLALQFSQLGITQGIDPALAAQAEQEVVEEPVEVIEIIPEEPLEVIGDNPEQPVEMITVQPIRKVPQLSLEEWISAAEHKIAEGDINPAIDLLFDGLNQHPQSVALYQLIALLMVNTGAFRSAEQMVNKALEIEPNAPELYNQLGTICYLGKDYAGSQAAYEKALEIAPDFEEARINLIEMQRGLPGQKEAIS